MIAEQNIKDTGIKTAINSRTYGLDQNSLRLAQT